MAGDDVDFFSSDSVFYSGLFLADYWEDGLYYAAGRLLVIIPRFLGNLIVERRFSVSSASASISSRVPVMWFSNPGIDKILSQSGLSEDLTCKQALIRFLRSSDKWFGRGSNFPATTFVYNPFIVEALNGG